MIREDSPQPVTVLIAALGGEGGGVLSSWVVNALESHGLVVQSTSIPGVAQRTGATTYYIETLPTPAADLGDRRPVLSLYPSAGDIDVMVASELVEAGRAVQNGYITPDRTTLIASTHRHYAIGERSAMADGTFESDTVLTAARQRSKTAFLADYMTLAKDSGTTPNAVLLGVLAGSNVLPAPAEAFENAIRDTGIAVEANLRGFELGLEQARQGAVATLPDADRKRFRETPAGDVEARARSGFPDALHETLVESVRRLVEFQSPEYATLYLDRLASIHNLGDPVLTKEVARHLALWMSYQDVIRVAQLKISAERHRRVLAEINAGDDDPVVITEFFKPGIDELCSILPSFLARPLLALSDGRRWRDRAHIGLHVKSTTINGFLRIWLLAKLRSWRPRSHGYREIQKTIEAWLALIVHAAGTSPALALEIALCAELIKGYGDTNKRGMASFDAIRRQIIEPALSGGQAIGQAPDAVASARAAALTDPTGERLNETINAIAAARSQAAE
jgi:indolepyruvate ferredoxin oxidoreductase, beta subunit